MLMGWMRSTSKGGRQRLAAAIIDDVHDFQDNEIDGQKRKKERKGRIRIALLAERGERLFAH